MLEKDIVNAIMKYLKTVPECFCWKEHGGMYGTAGIPDIIACVDGRFFAFEVKTEKGRPTALQEATIRKINAAGGTALVVRSVKEVKTVLEAQGGGKPQTMNSGQDAAAHLCFDEVNQPIEGGNTNGSAGKL